MARRNSRSDPEPVPVLRRLHVRQRRVRLSGVVVQHHGRRRARCRLRPDVRRPHDAVVIAQAVGIGQPAVRQRVLRVLDQGLAEEFERLQQAFLAALAQMVSALQVEIVRRQILDRPPPARARPFGELGLESFARWPERRVPGRRTCRCCPRRSIRTTDSSGSRVSIRCAAIRSRVPDARTLPLTIIAASALLAASSDARIRRLGNLARL